MKQYQHLKKEERFYIWNALRTGSNQKEVADILGRSPSTICREIKRNRYGNTKMYTYHWALEIIRNRKRRVARTKHRKLDQGLTEKIEQLIQCYLSPEQVSGYLSEHHEISISHETIYRYIYANKERHMKLKPFMRHGFKKRRKAYGSGVRASNIPNRVCITKRAAIVEEKIRIGDWECDTVIGKDRKSVLVTVVDRTSLYTCCSRVFGRTAKIVSAAIIRILKPHMSKVLTLTFDNGSEFVQHEKIGQALKADTYFAHPYTSCERAINENTNGLLRQFFPKGTDLRKVTWREVKDAVENLNNRPRKTRNYLTPNQLFNDKFVPLI
ncbi:MAG: IS30 family transposase [Thiohalomonadales bacterium]